MYKTTLHRNDEKGDTLLKTWMFAGIKDKSDLLLYLCLLLSSADKKVLLVDATYTHKYSLVIGQLDRLLSITEFMNFDVANGFSSQMDLENHLQELGEGIDSYDYVIYDIENGTFCLKDAWMGAEACFWTTDYGIWSFHKGTEWMKDWIQHNPELKGLSFQIIYLRTVDCILDRTYMDSYINKWPVIWINEAMAIPWDEVDIALKIENEHMRQLRIKPLSRRYKRVLCTLMEQITHLEKSNIKRALHRAERRKA